MSPYGLLNQIEVSKIQFDKCLKGEIHEKA